MRGKFNETHRKRIAKLLKQLEHGMRELDWLSLIIEFDKMFMLDDCFYVSEKFFDACGYESLHGLTPYSRHNQITERRVGRGA